MVYAIDGDIKEDIMWGLAPGILFIILNILYPNIFIIGYSQASVTSGDFLTPVIVASIVEEIVFRGILLSILETVIPFPLDWILNAVAFSAFHWSAYGLSLSSAFLGAGFFSLIACWITRFRGSIVPAIVLHGMVNAWLVFGQHMVFLG